MEPRRVSESKVIMTEMVLPSHTNSQGSIFGGTVMAWIDVCAAIAAQRHSRKPVVTASVDALQFIAPISKGWTVNLKASVNWSGKTSMEVGVRVDAENPMTGEMHHTASAYLTFVALGEDKLPSAVPPVLPETAAELRRFKGALIRRKSRLALREQLR